MTKTSPRQTTRAPEDGSRANSPVEMSEHLEQVRAILFGERFADFEKRLERLEQRLLEEQAELREATRRQFDALAADIGHQLSEVQRAVADGAAKHEKAMADLAGELQRSVTTTDERLAQAGHDADRLAGEHRAHTAERLEALAMQLTEQSSALSTQVEERLDRLHSLKTDRESLAVLFEEMAARLKRRPSG